MSVFEEFSNGSLEQLRSGSCEISFEAGEHIARQGDEAAHFGVILSGSVAAAVTVEGGERQVLRRLKAGDTFNEMALMTGDSVLADFIAESGYKVLLVPVSVFQSIIVSEPSGLQRISRNITERMRARRTLGPRRR